MRMQALERHAQLAQDHLRVERRAQRGGASQDVLHRRHDLGAVGEALLRVGVQPRFTSVRARFWGSRELARKSTRPRRERTRETPNRAESQHGARGVARAGAAEVHASIAARSPTAAPADGSRAR